MTDDTAEHRTFVTIPASPGWCLCDPIKAEGDAPASFWYRPIIAWTIERVTRDGCLNHHNTVPVPADGLSIVNVDWTLRDPKGRYLGTDTAEFENEHQALAHALGRE